MKSFRLITLAAAVLATGCATLPAHQEADARPDQGITSEILPALDAGSSLEQYLKYAALNNPGLKAAFHKWKAALERIPQSKALPNPQFTYSYYIDSVETRVGPQEHRLGLTQMFPWFGKLALKGDAAALAAEAACQEYEARKLDLFYRVTYAYYEYLYLADALEIASENVTLMRTLEDVALTKYTTGAAPHSAVIKAQVELGTLEDKLSRMKDLRRPLSKRLDAVLGRESQTLLAWPQRTARTFAFINYEDVSRRALALNPQIKAASHRADRESVNARLAGKQRYPDLMLGAGYILTGEASDPTMAESGKDAFTVSLGIDLPIWFGKLAADENESIEQTAAARNELKDQRNRLSSDVELAVYHYNDSLRRKTLYTDVLIPKARQSLEVSRQSFEAGKTDFLTLIDSQRMLLEFQLALKRADADAFQRLAEIEMLTAHPISSNEDISNSKIVEE